MYYLLFPILEFGILTFWWSFQAVPSVFLHLCTEVGGRGRNIFTQSCRLLHPFHVQSKAQVPLPSLNLMQFPDAPGSSTYTHTPLHTLWLGRCSCLLPSLCQIPACCDSADLGSYTQAPEGSSWFGWSKMWCWSVWWDLKQRSHA